MPSFDVVSEVKMDEVTNALDQTAREIGNRYDFKGTSAKVERAENTITVWGDSDFQLQQIADILYQRLAKRASTSARSRSAPRSRPAATSASSC